MTVSWSIYPDDESSLDTQGISKRFLNYFQHLDKSVGSGLLGPERTMTGQVQATTDAAVQHVRRFDEQGGYSKNVNEVSIYVPFRRKIAWCR